VTTCVRIANTPGRAGPPIESPAPIGVKIALMGAANKSCKIGSYSLKDRLSILESIKLATFACFGHPASPPQRTFIPTPYPR